MSDEVAALRVTGCDAFRRAMIADAPLATVEDAIRLIEHLVDMTDPHDRIGIALTMIVDALHVAEMRSAVRLGG